ncbi:MAG: hypothetical protein V2A62_05410 [Candidatus Woesearchaeota archaeon]
MTLSHGPKEVLEDYLPNNPMANYQLFGSRPVASLNREELKGLALKVWEEDQEEVFADVILLANVKELPVDGKKVYYAVSEVYVGN